MPMLTDFTGRPWTILRRIEDHRAGAQREFRGSAILRPGDAAFRYQETGLLQIEDGTVLRADREYLWCEDGTEIEVLFADGRPFHRFTPEGRTPGTEHHCGSDLYRVLYDFTGWPVWTAEWWVSGPAKEYVLRSRYEPAPNSHHASPDDPSPSLAVRLLGPNS